MRHSTFTHRIISWDNLIKLLSSEKARIEFALKNTKSRKEVYMMLQMPERSFYRKLRKYKLPYKGEEKT